MTSLITGSNGLNSSWPKKPKNKILWLGLVLGLSTVLVTSCSKDDGGDKKDGKATPQAGNDHSPQDKTDTPARLRIVDVDGKPIAKVQILVGMALNDPFKDNFIESDADGTFTAPAAWTQEMPITLTAPNYIRATYWGQMPQGQTLTLRSKDLPRNLELSGSQTGFQVIDRDGIVDFGLVIPALTKQDLFNFDIGMVLSPQTDEISVLGQKINLPSNITLPKQRETYIFPITLEKPNYRMYFASKGSKRIFSARGQFPLKTVVDEIRGGKSFFELASYLKINGGALKQVDISGDKNSANLPVNELVFDQALNVQGPVFDKDQVILGLALSEDRGSLFPTDIKNLTPNTKTALATAKGTPPLLLTVLKNKAETQGPGSDRLSATLIPLTEGVTPQMLAMMKNPQVISPTHVKADVVNAINGVVPVGSYAVLSAVEQKTSGNSTYEVLTRLWEVYDGNWSAEYNLPAWPNEILPPTLALPPGKKRWEVSRAASNLPTAGAVKNLDLGPRMFESVTHATHSSADF